MSLDTRKILFFIAGHVPTVAEAALIARIRGNVQVRSLKGDVLYGSGDLEEADGLAGSIPNSYKTGEGTTIDTELYPEGDVTPEATAYPEALGAFPAALTIKVGEAIPLSAYSADLNETTGAISLVNQINASKVQFASSDDTKATVAPTTGLVTGVAAGTATITATYTYSEGVTVEAEVAVTVQAATIENVLVSPATVSVAALATSQLYASEAKSDGTVSNVTATTGAWTSGDETKATVNANTGLVSGVAAGQSVITFTKGGKTATCTVTCTG